MRRPARKTTLGLASCIALVALARPASASPEDFFGYGPASQAMGMTGAAIGRGFEATYTNPALLSLSRDRKLSLGFQGARYALYADGPSAPGNLYTPSMRGMIIGATLPLGFGGVLRDRVTVGVGFFTPSNVVVRGRILYPETLQFGVIADRAQSVAVQAGLGANLGHGFRVGGGFGALAAIAGKVLVATNESGQVGTKVDDQLVATYGPIVGASYDIGEAYRFGATYRGVLDARFAVTIVVKDLGSLDVPPFNIAGLAQYDPRQLQLELARVKGPWRGALGVTYKQWSPYTGPPEPTVLCPETYPDCKALGQVPFEFHDTWTPRVGVERELSGGDGIAMKLRAGWAFEPSPAPEQKREMNFLDSSRHVITAGYGIELDAPYAPISLDFFWQAHALVGRTHTKDPDVSPTNPGAPWVRSSGHVLLGGLVLGVKL
jgi:long-chain fatty acid transport protein